MSHDKPNIERIRQLLRDAGELGLSARACERLRWMLHYCEHGYSVTATCRHFGIPRMTFYRTFERFNPEDPASLENQMRRPPAPKRAAPGVVALVQGYRLRMPHLGKERIAELLGEEHGLEVSASTVGRIIERECLYFAATPHHWRKRIQAPAHAHDGHFGDEHHCPRCHGPAQHVYAVQPPLFAGSVQPPQGTPTSGAPMLRPHMGKALKRGFLLASLLINVALIASLLTTALWESRKAPPLPAQLSSDATVSSLVHP